MNLSDNDIGFMYNAVLEWNRIAGNEAGDTSLRDTYLECSLEELNEMNGEIVIEKHLDAVIDSIFTLFFLNSVSIKTPIPNEDTWLWPVVGDDEIYNTLYEAIVGDDPSFIGITLKLFLTKLRKDFSKRYDIVGAFKRVLESNNSKFVEKNSISGVEIEEEVRYISQQGRYADVYSEIVDDYIIFRARYDLESGKYFPKGKIVKPRSFKSVEDLGGLSEFINI